MKVLVYSTNGVLRDGITLWLKQYYSLMNKSDLSVDTIAFPGVDEALVNELRDGGVRTHVMPSRMKSTIQYLKALRKLIKRNAYDIVHINGNSGTIALDLLCCVGTTSRVRIVHSRNTQGDHPLADNILRPLMMRLSTARFACGSDAGKWLFGDKDFEVILNGKEFGIYEYRPEIRTKMRARLGLSEEDVAIGHVAKFNKQKNHTFLLDAFASAHAKNPRLRLFLIGDGRLTDEMRKKADDLGLSAFITFMGRSGEVPELLNAFDLAVLPSLHEGFPNVVIEWQINGLPSLVSTSVTEECGVTDLVDFVPRDDTAAWANAMANFSGNDRARASETAQLALSEAGFSAQEGADRILTLYKSYAR